MIKITITIRKGNFNNHNHANDSKHQQIQDIVLVKRYLCNDSEVQYSLLLIRPINSIENQDSPPAEYGSRHRDTKNAQSRANVAGL